MDYGRALARKFVKAFFGKSHKLGFAQVSEQKCVELDIVVFPVFVDCGQLGREVEIAPALEHSVVGKHRRGQYARFDSVA